MSRGAGLKLSARPRYIHTLWLTVSSVHETWLFFFEELMGQNSEGLRAQPWSYKPGSGSRYAIESAACFCCLLFRFVLYRLYPCVFTCKM